MDWLSLSSFVGVSLLASSLFSLAAAGNWGRRRFFLVLFSVVLVFFGGGGEVEAPSTPRSPASCASSDFYDEIGQLSAPDFFDDVGEMVALLFVVLARLALQHPAHRLVALLVIFMTK